MRLLAVAALGSMFWTSTSFAQGQRIPVKDGDVVLINSGAQVRIVKRGDAMVRAIFNPDKRWVVILADYAAPNGSTDGGVDKTYTFYELDTDWPMGERWEGKAALEEYSVAGEIGPSGLGIVLPGGLVQLFDSRGDKLFRDASAVSVIPVHGGAGGGGGNQSFDAMERMQVASAIRSTEMNAVRRPAGGQGGLGFSSSVSMSIGPVTPATAPVPAPRAPEAPVRVGGNIRTPRRIQDRQPVLPETARQAGVRGVVILEITIGPDGAVNDAKILNSIPLLDQAALDAVRGWRYEPTLLNGTPVPVIMTVTVNFP